MDIGSLIGVLVFLSLIIFGYVFKRMNKFNQKTSDKLHSLIFNIILPVFLFSALLTVNFDLKMISVFIVGSLLGGMLFLVGLAYTKIFKIDNKNVMHAMTTFEGSMIAWPIFVMLFGAENLFMIALIDLGQALLYFSVLFLFLFSSKEKSLSQTVKSFLPIIIGISLGLLFNFTGLHVWLQNIVVYSFIIKILGYSFFPLVILVAVTIGIDTELKLENIFVSLKIILLRYVSVVIISLFLFFAILANLGFSIEYLHALLIYSLAPCSIVLPVVVPKENRKFIANYASVFIPLSIVVMAIYILVVS